MSENDLKQKTSKELTNLLGILPESVQISVLLILKHLGENAVKYDAAQKRTDLCAGEIEEIKSRIGDLENRVETRRTSFNQKTSPAAKAGRYSISSFLKERFPDLYKNIAGFTIKAGEIAETGIVPFQEETFKRSHYHFSADDKEIIEGIHKYLIETVKVGRKRTELPKSLITLMSPPAQTQEIRPNRGKGKSEEEYPKEVYASENGTEYVTNHYIFRKTGLDVNGWEDFRFGDFKDRYGRHLGKSYEIPGTRMFGWKKTDADNAIIMYLQDELKKREELTEGVSG